MKKIFKRVMALILVAVMTFTAVPLSGFEAKASGLTGYSAGAAAKWGRDHINDVWSPLLGYGIWENGGDCANYVSQCLYMGGLDMTGAWHSNGCMRYYAALSDGVFIRAQQLHDYLVSIGGQSIRNPSADQLSLGDVLFFKRSGAARCTHSAIVIDFENGQPVIGYHSILNKAGVYEIGRTTDIDLDFMRENTYLVKLNGSICTAQKSRDFDVYIANKSTGLYSSAGGYGFIRNVIGSDYIHVYSTQYANGSTWGYTFCRGYWGWVKIADCNYQTHVSTPEVNHKFGGWYVAKPATCLTSGYEQRDCTVCGFSQQRTITGGHLVKKHATCLTPGFCSICGAAIEEALGHDFGDWSFITEPTCTESGVRTHICKRCGFEEQEEVAPLGHDDIHVSTPPSCTDIGTAMYECQRCGRTIANYINSENTVTDWTPEVIDGLKPVETKIQYSYRDKSFTSSYGTGIDGWTQYSYEWVQSGSGSANMVYSWPAGFDTNNWFYQNYQIGPFTPYETEIAKRDVSTIHVGYLNAHWCRGEYSSNTNRSISNTWTSTFDTFHAFDSTDNKATSVTENAYQCLNRMYCDDSHWWHINLQTPYYWTTYTDYNKLFHYYKWSDWSGWTDEEISASDTREVQTRTVYKYNLAALGHDFSVVDSQKDPTCTEPGYIGKSCSRCGAISPDAEIIPSGHELYDEISERGWHKISEENGVITWRRDCQRFCGYYEEKQEKEKGECVFELKEIIESTCEEDGKIISVCKYHNEEKTEIIKAKGHEPDNNWITEYGSTCANGGKDGKEICYCVRHDNGKTCSKVFERPIPAPAHIAVKDPPVPPTCTESGYKEGSHCDVCKETLIERVVDPALGHEPDNNWIVVEEPGCDKDGKEICYCVRHDDGVTCDKIFDRPIPGIPATYKEIKRVESSCAECGYIEYTCINCEGTENEHGYTEPLPLDPNGHAEGVWKTLQEAQICEIPGIEVSECPLCGEMLDKKEIPPQYEKHNMVKEVIKSSCTTSGITNEYCTQCGLTLDPVDDDPLGHDLGDWVVEKEATCTEHGEKRQYCHRDGCSYYIPELIAPIGHDYKVSQVIAPLCEEIGKTIYVCQNDSSHTFEGDFVPALGHEPDGNWIVTKEPDCTNKGTEQCDCVRHDDGVTCDTVFIRDIEIDPDAHDWGDWFVDADPNCVDKGIEKRICNINNEHIQTKETVTDPDNHDMGEWYEVTKATCTEKGLEKRDCNRCDYYEERETAIDPDNHYAETFYTVDEKADCENDGKKSHHCERCDKSLDEVVISKRNHVYDNGVETTAPTCTEDGVKTFTCTNKETNEYKACTHSYTEVIPATDHAWDDGVIDPDSTCKVHGTKTYTCQNDTSHTKTEEVPLDENNHVGKTYIKDNKDATCTEDGYTGDIYCSDCDKKLEDGKVIPALGHDMGEWYEVTKATCTEKGLEKRDCNRCDYSEERETAIDPDNHYAETFYTVDEKADCEKDGKKSHHCERCDKSLDEVVISKRNHVYDNGVETKAPTCTEDGVMTFTCTNEETNEYKACTHSYTEVIPATGHDWGEWETETPATCEADGLERRICKNDASHVDENVLTALGHKWDDGVINPDSTCKVHGTKTYTCQNDASHTKTEEVPLDENNHVGDTYIKDNKDATCTEDGYTGDIYCSDCDKKLEDGKVIPALGHDMGEWYEVTKATCTEKGLEKRDCNRCDYYEERETEIDPDNHYAETFYTVDEKADCENDGKKSHHCERCDKSLDEVVISKRNHAYDDGVETTAPTCTEDGIMTFTCINEETNEYKACTHSYTEVISALGHNMGEWYEVTKATCTEKGLEKRDCNRCDYSEERETAIDPDNHYAETFYTVDEKADCENDGKKSHHCERCDKPLDEVVISKRNHAYDDGVETTAPTCTEDGVKTFTCTNEKTNEYKACTHLYTEVIPATGHDWGEWKIIPGKEPTIYEKGRERCICNNDSSHIQERDVDKLESRVAYFIVADENGDFEYEGKKYTLVDTVRFALGTTVIINPDVPEMEGYYGYWEDYTISNKDLYIEAKYELKSGDNQSDLVSDKNVVYKDGVATITLSAFAETLNAKVPMGATPYDIVLVLDQSSSMEREFGSDKTASNYNNSRIKVLKDVAISFIQTVYDSSVENNVDHRIAIVGFSGTEYSYKNTGLLTPSGTVKTFDKLTDKDYASAFVDVRVQKNILDASINNMVIKTGTAADYGMQMARQVLANNRNSEREKLVLFITDGEPADVQGRNYWPFSKPIANDTIDYANQIKQDYDATIYSVGVAAGADPDDETKDLNIYLHNVSSNYPDAKSMTEKGKSSPMKNYFLTAEDKDAVSRAFESIVAQKITNTISFTKVNFYDTISEYFTLTTENENALRQSVKEKYGVTDRDIIITRNADGTTTVRINNLIPKPVFDENNVQTGYGVTVDFDVTANEKTLDGGTFLTNNENAGIEHDGKTVIDFKIPEGEVISSGRAIVEFRIGDEVYAIREVNIGDNVIVPETDVADWIITEGATITSDYTVFNAEYTTETNTVEWIIGDEKITQTYHTGEIISIPEIDVPENKIFTGWSTAVPYRMPAYALSFTAVFKSHEHNFTEQDKQGDCVSGIVHIFTCDCGYSYTTQDSPAKHSYTANVHLVNNESVATMTCSVCGAAESSVINYKAQYNQFGSAKVVDLTLHDNKGISVQPDGYIYIKIAEDQKVLSNAKTGKLVVTRVNADNSTDKIPYLKNGSADSVGYYVEGSYIILKLDHFSYYVMTIPEEDGQIPSFGKIECAFNGHNYESVITAPTCTTEGYTTHTCTSCGDVYTDAETGITEHIYENNICIHCGEVKEINCSHACHKNGFIGFIWKIFNFIFRIFGIESERFCDCGADHW